MAEVAAADGIPVQLALGGAFAAAPNGGRRWGTGGRRARKEGYEWVDVWSGQLTQSVEEGARSPAFPAEPHSRRTGSSLAWDFSPPGRSPRSRPLGPTFGQVCGLSCAVSQMR